MVNEFWGTLSIYDHRNPIFIKSLILFDRIVIPIPDKPVGDQTNEELDNLFATATYLQNNNAAVIYDWKQTDFNSWRNDIIREALTVKERDSLYDSRLMLQTKVDNMKPKGVFEITAIPVYGARENFLEAYSNINPVTQENLLLEISQLISVPEQKSSIEAIIELRHKESFQSARIALRDWQFQKIPEVIQEHSEKRILLAKEEFEQMLKRYEEEIKKGKFGKTKIVVTSLLALGSLFSAAIGQIPTAIALMSGAAPQLFSLKESMSPAWKDLREKKFEPAGVIYEANKIFND